MIKSGESIGKSITAKPAGQTNIGECLKTVDKQPNIKLR
jgi:hypothetical protein